MMFFDRDRHLIDEADKGPFSGLGGVGPRAHQYLYAYLGIQKEGIFQRIRQGIGGPEFLEQGAQVMGHVHISVNQPPLRINDVIEMPFRRKGKSEVWLVRVTSIYEDVPSNQHPMVLQDDLTVIGYHIQGVCVQQIQ